MSEVDEGSAETSRTIPTERERRGSTDNPTTTTKRDTSATPAILAALTARHTRVGRPKIANCSCGTIICPDLQILEAYGAGDRVAAYRDEVRAEILSELQSMLDNIRP